MRKILCCFVGAASLLGWATAAPAQGYDPRRDGSPLTLMAAPKDGVAYFEDKLRARSLSADKKFAELEPVAERLVAAYPRDPENWLLLGKAKRGLGKHLEAVDAFAKAGPLIGWVLQSPNGFRVASERLKAGDRKGALEMLRWLVFEQHSVFRQDLYEWEEFAALRKDPEFLRIIGRPDVSGLSRNEGWRRDIDFLHDEVKRVNPDYRALPFPAEVESRYAALKRDAPKLSDEQIYFGMKRMLAPLHQGHLSFWPMPKSRFLPLRLYAFPEGVFILQADPAHRELEGAQVLQIGALSADEAFRRQAESHSVDGDNQHLWEASELAFAADLVAMGAIKDQGSALLKVRTRDGSVREVSVATTATPPPDSQTERWDRLAAPPGAPPPMFLSHMSSAFWRRALPEHQALYVQVNNMHDTPDESLAAYGRRLWTVLQEAKADNLILDIRHNNGGTTQLYPELLRTIVAFSRVPGHRVYVLIGRRTYSATGNFVTDLERLADPIFVGEASSECCNLYGDPTEVTLPYSKVQLETTALRWQLSYPGDTRREINPDMPVQLTAADYFAGRDPALEATFNLIDGKKAPAVLPDRVR